MPRNTNGPRADCSRAAVCRRGTDEGALEEEVLRGGHHRGDGEARATGRGRGERLARDGVAVAAVAAGLVGARGGGVSARGAAAHPELGTGGIDGARRDEVDDAATTTAATTGATGATVAIHARATRAAHGPQEARHRDVALGAD